MFGSSVEDSEMADVRGVERQAYSKEAPGKSPVVHSSENHLGRDQWQAGREGEDM